MKKSSIHTIAYLAMAAVLLLSACRKNDYYVDGGLSAQSEAEKKMPVYDFLASRSNHMFDSLLKIIDLTGSKALVNQANITFFAVPNVGIIRFQQNYNPDSRQTPRQLSEIGKDTLLRLLNRFIVPNSRVTLEQGLADKRKYYPAPTGDSLFINGGGGGTSPGSSIQTSAFFLTYEHRKIPGIDTTVYTGGIQTHNLVTANAIVHVLNNSSNFAAGHKHKYYR